MSVVDNLKEAFAGESQANRKYLAFAKKADEDGYPQVAKLFRAAAEAETIHAHAHLRAMDGVHGTLENLEEAIAGETYEYEEMYPPFLANAQSEGHKKAEFSFKNALAVEKVHADLYKQAFEAVKAGQDLAADKIYVCDVCGHTLHGDAPDRCPICSAKHDRFFEVK
jgi:rubrerythrin